MKETTRLRAHLLQRIHAGHDIRIYRTTVIACGAPGIVIAIQAIPGRETYTGEFQPAGLAGATIRVRGLTYADLLSRGPPA